MSATLFPPGTRSARSCSWRKTWLVLACVLAMGATALTTATASAQAAPSVSKSGHAEAPRVIPALTDWMPGKGSYRFDNHSRILIPTSKQPLRETARTLAEDLEKRFGGSVPVVSSTKSARPGDVVLRIDPDRSKLEDEGYEIVVGDLVHISGATDAGAFYGTRTLLQMLTDDRTAPGGRTVDVPRYPERGIGLGLYRYSMPRIERIMRDMAYLKLNYLLLEVPIQSDSHPEAVRWPYYTKDEARRIAELADKYHITVIPEVNAPGHMGPYLYNHPELQLTGRDGNKAQGRLDITNPKAFNFYTDLIDEWTRIFDSPYWHMGADEYMWGTSYENFPQIGEYAKRKYGPDAVPQDAFLGFINRVDNYVSSKGMQLRIWNDGLPENSTVSLHSDIVIEHWISDPVNPSGLVAAGHPVMNAASALYHNRGNRVSYTTLCGDVPASKTTLMGCVAKLWDKGWHPGVFEDERLDAGTPGVRGAKISLWPGPATAQTEAQVQQDMFMPLRFLSQRTWGSTEPFISYERFTARAQTLGHAPGWGQVHYRPLPDGTYVLRDPAAGALTAPGSEPGSEVTTGARRDAWKLRHTDDGYYRIVSTSSGLCLDTRRGRRHLGAPMEPRTPITVETCDSRNTQKWEIVRREHGAGFTITNAITRMVANADREAGRHDAVVQMPRHRTDAGRWLLTPRGQATVKVDASAARLERGQANLVTVSFTNHATSSVTDVTLRLNAPSEWQTHAETDKSFPSVASGGTVTATFAVTPPADASYNEDYLLTARAMYETGRARKHAVTGASIVHVDLTVCTNPREPVDPSTEFNGSALNGCRWTTVLGPDPSGITVAEGKLGVETRYTTIPDAGGGITNVPLQDAPEGDWVATVKMRAPLQQRYQLGGLMVYGGGNDFVVFDLVADNPAGAPLDPRLELISEQDANYGKGGWINDWTPPTSPDGTWWLRLTKDGAAYSGSYSIDGETWITMPGTVTNAIDDPKIGLLATQSYRGQPSTTVSFDSFHLGEKK